MPTEERLAENPPAFPVMRSMDFVSDRADAPDYQVGARFDGGMTLRDYFAAHVHADDRLVKAVRAMDDSALELFALHPDVEREDWITDVDLTNWFALPSEVAKVARRYELEARAIARVRYMQADAMLAVRAEGGK